MPWRRTWQPNPLQYSCLENLIDRGAWPATVHGGHKESDMTEQLSTQAAHLYCFSRKGTWCFPDRQLAYNPALQTKEHSKSGESMTQKFTNKPQSYQFKFRIFTGFTMFHPLWFLVSVDSLGSDVYVCLVKTMVFPVVMYGCESWTLKKAECWRIDAFELWCWRILLRIPWTARRSNQCILKKISPEYSLEGLMLKLKSNT